MLQEGAAWADVHAAVANMACGLALIAGAGLRDVPLLGNPARAGALALALTGATAHSAHTSRSAHALFTCKLAVQLCISMCTTTFSAFMHCIKVVHHTLFAV